MALGRVFLPGLVSTVSIIPPLLHTHPSIYHPHCIMFFSQYFSFPLSVPFHHCSILVFIYTLLLPEGQRANTGTFQKPTSFCKSACNRQQIPFTLFTFRLHLFLSLSFLFVTSIKSIDQATVRITILMYLPIYMYNDVFLSMERRRSWLKIFA